jgi:hypothetical protein
MSITFTKDKETKTKVRFSANEGDVSGSLYVAKDSELAKQETLILEIPETVEA